jgi:hypothetical protein
VSLRLGITVVPPSCSFLLCCCLCEWAGVAETIHALASSENNNLLNHLETTTHSDYPSPTDGARHTVDFITNNTRYNRSKTSKMKL